MVIVIPLVSIATFLLSHWVTTTYIDPANDASDPALSPNRTTSGEQWAGPSLRDGG